MSGIDFSSLRLLAEAASASYGGVPRDDLGYKVTPISNGWFHATVLESLAPGSNSIIVSIRGTNDALDWVEDVGVGVGIVYFNQIQISVTVHLTPLATRPVLARPHAASPNRAMSALTVIPSARPRRVGGARQVDAPLAWPEGWVLAFARAVALD